MLAYRQEIGPPLTRPKLLMSGLELAGAELAPGGPTVGPSPERLTQARAEIYAPWDRG